MVLRLIQIQCLITFQLQHLVNLIHAYHSYGLWEDTYQFWCFASHTCVSFDRGALHVQIIFSDLDVSAYILLETLTYHLKAQRIRKNMVPKLPAPR